MSLLTEDTYFFGKPTGRGTRVAVGVQRAGHDTATPFLGPSVGPIYDPSEVAAAWRLVPRFRASQPFMDVVADIDRLENIWRRQAVVNRNMAYQRFTLTTDFTATVDSAPTDEFADAKNDAQLTLHCGHLNALITREAQLWGISRKTLAAVIAAEVFNATTTSTSPNHVLFMNKKLGVKGIVPEMKPPRSHLFGGLKKKRFRRKRGGKRGFKRRR